MLRIALVLALAFATPPVQAQTVADQGAVEDVLTASDLTAEAQALLDAIGLGEVITIMVAEGRDYGDVVEADLFPGRGGTAWDAAVASLYDPERLAEAFVAGFTSEGIEPAALDALTAFFTSDLGRRIVGAEIEARREMSDPAVETAAGQVYLERRRNGDERIALLDVFTETNALLDLNVVGALNANFAFYQGLVDAGAYDPAPTEADMIAETWASEAEVRDATELWLYSYQWLAYQGLSDAELAEYIEISASEPGQAFNRALFAAFDAMYDAVSYELGLTAGLFMLGDDI